ncbi:MAG: cytochrome d ubiquinol oxidase subunit II [Bacteroidales bacterium]|jgi:cytochrome d ubiquinol oxidase subunit II|nr:cytochrome d ubiquinol oxidase subunit II [Bacteroidales bacterium]HOL98981.1 cytochrome d ubiquinol oxidase subunit II [Bacteroidales bacterium]HRS99520.1 cytochrome d ubiquinol oxidase subunit II [Bacteroidales bacterium]HRT80614.1 cytochrome d ubiquinol oxidase subunit II [Bacteroidales bacterium]HUM32370.1 cytochrome d ubiquinol oxidase subunit II [Bacteroidales bacterium]
MITAEISYLFLQQYWYFIVSLLGALLVFLMFVQGGQTLIYEIGKNDTERKMLVTTLGRKWELTFTTLVTFGGAFFASFPLFYSTSFGGAYWAWIALLLAFTIQAVSYEFRSKKGNVFGPKFFEVLLFLNGLFGTLLLGTVVGTFFNGSEFSIDVFKRVTWANETRGLEAVLNWHNVSLGLAVFFLARIMGLLYFKLTIDYQPITDRIRKKLLINTIPFLVFFLAFVIRLLIMDGFAVDENGVVFMQKTKYLNNFLDMPLILVMFLIGVLAVLFGIIRALFLKKSCDMNFWYVAPGVVLTVLSLLLLAGYNNTAFYPSSFDLQSSLTIHKASSSFFTLKVMSIVSLLVPVVLAVIIITWRQINKFKITQEEINNPNEKTY